MCGFGWIDPADELISSILWYCMRDFVHELMNAGEKLGIFSWCAWILQKVVVITQYLLEDGVLLLAH